MGKEEWGGMGMKMGWVGDEWRGTGLNGERWE